MCGLVGCVLTVAADSRAWLSIGRDELKHRGPDDAGEWWSDDGHVGLAHRRLSILDLSDLGHQPMQMRERGLSIVFNGEIYNYKELRQELRSRGRLFHSSSDTEVLLAAYAEWGDDFLARLNGMFAFALYDALKQRMLLARDRVGEKPLFYKMSGHGLFFASELKALLAHPAMDRRIDADALDCYLMFGYVPGARCILEGYNKLPAGHALAFDLRERRSTIWAYWKVPEFAGAASGDEDELLDELERLLQDAVSLQLRADVPVGVLLSGGVDSSLITALAVRQSSQVRTFSVGFPGHSVDETAYARLVADYLGTRHTELVAEDVSADIVPKLAVHFDEPMADSSMIPTYLVSRLVREQCTVALGGDGADELFGGYQHYSRLLRVERYVSRTPEFLRRFFSHGADRILPVGFRGRNYLRVVGSGGQPFSLPLVGVLFDAVARRNLMRDRAPWKTPAEGIARTFVPPATDLLERATRFDFATYLPDDILVKVDRASMLNSLEMRAPMLDYRVIEFAFCRVPPTLKATTDQRKILLKRLTERLLPPEFDRQRKQGFSIPLAAWLRDGPYRELFHDVLLQPHCLFDRETVLGLLNGQRRGLPNGERLFALVLFELWRQAYAAHL
jgi:asparagine synthase (glutamine-hydrolysing)